MKALVAILCVAMAAITASAADKPAPPAKVTPAKEKQPAKKKVYELPKTGVNQPRTKGGWINVQAVGTRLIVKFYDKEKKPISPDVVRGFAQFRFAAKNPERASLNLEGETLASTATVRPPHNFIVMLNLFDRESPGPTETYNFKYP